MRFGKTKKSPAPVVPKQGKLPYFNRELSWLAFNRRVLDIAISAETPLLERLKFLSIVSSNLDEFFQIRVAGLIQQVDAGLQTPGFDGLTPSEQLRRIHMVVASQVDDQYACWKKDIVPALKAEGIIFKTAKTLSQRELRWVRRYFETEVFPALTPLAIDPSHPLPPIGNKTLNVVAAVEDPEKRPRTVQLAIVPVPRVLPRVVPVDPDGSKQTVLMFIGDIIKLCVERLFPGCRVTSAKLFRVTRNSDLYIDEEEAENLLKTIEAELRNLRRGAAVRLEVEEGVNERLFQKLLEHVDLPIEYVFRFDGPINFTRLMGAYEMIKRPDLKFRPIKPFLPPEFAREESIFATIDKRDRLLHHPYESFDPVVKFVEAAAQDPQVFAIKQTLYRTSGDSPIVAALIAASRNGKQVTALIELKARFDEANNIQWARQMEEAGVQVVYGIVGLKIHAKCCLVVRKEGNSLRHYVHLGTGNYNPRTARLYTDFSFFTARTDITSEVAALFNTLTGYGKPPEFKKLLVAPLNLQPEIIRLINVEIENAKTGKPAHIRAQLNSLIDKSVIDSLYAASHAGVKIELVIRGLCGLVPRIAGVSENISVRSIVGQFLEHSRVYYFENGGKPLLYLGSADLMPRNLYRRVEVVFPVEDPDLRNRIVNEYFPVIMRDTARARELRPNGSYESMETEGKPLESAQEILLNTTSGRTKQA